MSGGVDSSVAAALLVEQGHGVVGVGLRFPAAPGSECCGAGGLDDARRVASRLGIPFYALDYRELFRRHVMEPFCRSYAAGETPNPCLACNARLKFGALLSAALELGAESVATGHYARIVTTRSGERRLARGTDPAHDQSYFLHTLTPEQMAHVRLPVGALCKDRVRALAARFGLGVADKPSSQDICFVGAGGYRRLLAERAPEALREGPVVDGRGAVVGRHRGIGTVTVGQRSGLGVAVGKRVYVTRVDARRNLVVVGDREACTTRALALRDVHWAGRVPSRPVTVVAQTRYRGRPVAATVRFEGAGAEVRFAGPQAAVAPGQAVVLYRGDVIVGGGTCAGDRDGAEARPDRVEVRRACTPRP